LLEHLRYGADGYAPTIHFRAVGVEFFEGEFLAVGYFFNFFNVCDFCEDFGVGGPGFSEAAEDFDGDFILVMLTCEEISLDL
jgi:hypothetical protein